MLAKSKVKLFPHRLTDGMFVHITKQPNGNSLSQFNEKQTREVLNVYFLKVFNLLLCGPRFFCFKWHFLSFLFPIYPNSLPRFYNASAWCCYGQSWLCKLKGEGALARQSRCRDSEGSTSDS